MRSDDTVAVVDDVPAVADDVLAVADDVELVAGGGVEPPHPASNVVSTAPTSDASGGPPRDPAVVPCADAVEVPQVVAPVSATCSVGGEQADNLIHVE